MADHARPRGLVDTSVLIDPPDASLLPTEVFVSAISLAELTAGTLSSADAGERAARQDRLQRIEATTDVLPFDATASRAYGRVVAAVAATGRKARGRRALDLLIAATALAEGLPLYTRNPRNFGGLDGVVEVIEVG